MTGQPARIRSESLAAFAVARSHASAQLFLGQPGFADFWVRKRRRLVLLAAIVSRSAWLAPPGEPVAFATLAAEAGLSFGSVERVVGLAARTGDLVVTRAVGEDARLLRVEPTATVRDAFTAMTLGFFDRAATTFGRPNPAAPLSRAGACPLVAVRIYALHLLAFGRTLPPGALRQDSVNFLFLLMGLAQAGGSAERRAFVRQQTAALRVALQTTRNLLQEAARLGFIATGPRIVLLQPGADWLENEVEQRRRLWNQALDRLEAALRSGAAHFARSTAP